MYNQERHPTLSDALSLSSPVLVTLLLTNQSLFLHWDHLFLADLGRKLWIIVTEYFIYKKKCKLLGM